MCEELRGKKQAVLRRQACGELCRDTATWGRGLGWMGGVDVAWTDVAGLAGFKASRRFARKGPPCEFQAGSSSDRWELACRGRGLAAQCA